MSAATPAPSALFSASRSLLLERAMLMTLFNGLIADYTGSTLPYTDSWSFFVLACLYIGTPAQQQRPVVIAFIIGCIMLFSDLLFLAIVSAGASGLPPHPWSLCVLLTAPHLHPPSHLHPPQAKRSPASNAFCAFQYIFKAAATYLLYQYLRSDLGGILSLAGEPGATPSAITGADYQYKDSSAAFAGAGEGASEAQVPYSGGYTLPSGGYNSSPASGGSYQTKL